MTTSTSLPSFAANQVLGRSGPFLEHKRDYAKTPHGTVPVGFFSRKLWKHQFNCTQREKQTYAVVKALNKWSRVIFFEQVDIITDPGPSRIEYTR